MSKVNSLLSLRLGRKKDHKKMTDLAQSSADGRLTGFAGIFGVQNLDEESEQKLRSLLEEYAKEDSIEIDRDLHTLSSLTSEVRAISNQAAILHGERIKKAQQLLKRYREGAFSSWLMTTYGNRQTPYNFLQYYDFHQEMPRKLHTKLSAMPRQAIYTLASREGKFSKKEAIVKKYNGETKSELLDIIRETFPLDEGDQRRSSSFDQLLTVTKRLQKMVDIQKMDDNQRESLRQQLTQMLNVLRGTKG